MIGTFLAVDLLVAIARPHGKGQIHLQVPEHPFKVSALPRLGHLPWWWSTLCQNVREMRLNYLKFMLSSLKFYTNIVFIPLCTLASKVQRSETSIAFHPKLQVFFLPWITINMKFSWWIFYCFFCCSF